MIPDLPDLDTPRGSLFVSRRLYQRGMTVYETRRCWQHLQLGQRNPLSALIELDLLPRHHTLLQRTRNLHRIHRAIQPNRRRRIVQATRRELIRLGDKRLPEPSKVVRRHLAPDPRGIVDVHQVQLRRCVDGDLALRTDDFGGVFLSGGHHAGDEKLGDFAVLRCSDWVVFISWKGGSGILT